MTPKLSLPRTSHFLDITLWTNGWMQWPTRHKSWRDWTSRIVSCERFKTAQELLTQPWQTCTFSQPRRWYSWLARKLLPCLVPAHSHVLSLTQMCGTYPVYSSPRAVPLCLEGRVWKDVLTEGIERDTIMPTPPTGAGQQSMLVVNDPVMQPEREFSAYPKRGFKWVLQVQFLSSGNSGSAKASLSLKLGTILFNSLIPQGINEFKAVKAVRPTDDNKHTNT